jgi:hypothetical protein
VPRLKVGWEKERNQGGLCGKRIDSYWGVLCHNLSDTPATSVHLFLTLAQGQGQGQGQSWSWTDLFTHIYHYTRIDMPCHSLYGARAGPRQSLESTVPRSMYFSKPRGPTYMMGRAREKTVHLRQSHLVSMCQGSQCRRSIHRRRKTCGRASGTQSDKSSSRPSPEPTLLRSARDRLVSSRSWCRRSSCMTLLGLFDQAPRRTAAHAGHGRTPHRSGNCLGAMF